jgi:hypothetical protein
MFPKEKHERSHPHVVRCGGGMSSGAHPCVHQGAWESVQAKYLYDSIDTDHSGTITYKEFESYIKKHETGHCGQHLTDEQRQEIFELMDLNHSGAIDRKEFEQCRKDFGGEWTVANFNDIIWKLKSKTPHGSCPTSPTARSRGSSPTALARPLNGTLPTSPTVRFRKASPTPNGRVTSPTAMRPNGCFSCVLARLHSRQTRSPILRICLCLYVSVAIRLPRLPSVSSSYVSSPLFILPFVSPLCLPSSCLL